MGKLIIGEVQAAHVPIDQWLDETERWPPDTRHSDTRHEIAVVHPGVSDRHRVSRFVSVWRDGRTPTIDDEVSRYRVEEVVHWENAAPAFKILAFGRRKPGVRRDAFVAGYLAHAALARRHHPAMVSYAQNYVVSQRAPTDQRCAVIAELGFASLEDLRTRMYRDDSSQAIVENDVRSYLDRPAMWSHVVAMRREV